MDLTALQNTLREFAAERDWQPFHTPKNLAMALMIEAAELAEIFQWMTPEQSQAAHHDHVTQERISDEVADVLLYLLQVADHTAVDLKRAVGRKLVKNARKHPPVKPGVPVGPKDTALPQTHVLVDWENVQPRDVDIRALVSDVTDVWLFHGPSQRNVDRDQTAFGDRVTCVPISRAGKNALDFHLSFYMGYIASRNPAARFVVLSNDKGYGPMLEHAVDLGFSAALVGFDKTGRRRAPARGPARPATRPADGRKPASQARRGAPLAVPAAAPPPAERRGRNRGRGGDAAGRSRGESAVAPLADSRREAGPAARPADASRRGRRGERPQPASDEPVMNDVVLQPPAIEAADVPPPQEAPPAAPAVKRSRRRASPAPVVPVAGAEPAVTAPTAPVSPVEATKPEPASGAVPAKKAPAKRTRKAAAKTTAASTAPAQADAAAVAAPAEDEPPAAPAKKARAARKTSPRAAAKKAAAAAASTPAVDEAPTAPADLDVAAEEVPATRSRARKTAAKAPAKAARKLASAEPAADVAERRAPAAAKSPAPAPAPAVAPASAPTPASTPAAAPEPVQAPATATARSAADRAPATTAARAAAASAAEPSEDSPRGGGRRRGGRTAEAAATPAGNVARQQPEAPRNASQPRQAPDPRRGAPSAPARQAAPAPAPAPTSGRPFDLEKSLRHVEASLRKTANKPTRRARLMATIRSLLGQWADDATTQAVLQRLLSSGRVSIDGQGAVAYDL